MIDIQLLEQLDKSISNIGTSVIWKQKIGDITVWLSPISFENQQKITSRISESDNTMEIVFDVKRITLSYAIVGLNDVDLTPYTNEEPNFKIYNKKIKKDVNVPLHTYIYEKIMTWSSEYVDKTFSVYSTLLDSYKDKISTDVKFDDVKDPQDELNELEFRINELRLKLNMKPINFQSYNEQEQEDATKSDFDPFKPVNSKKGEEAEEDTTEAKNDTIEKPNPDQPTENIRFK